MFVLRYDDLSQTHPACLVLSWLCQEHTPAVQVSQHAAVAQPVLVQHLPTSMTGKLTTQPLQVRPMKSLISSHASAALSLLHLSNSVSKRSHPSAVSGAKNNSDEAITVFDNVSSSESIEQDQATNISSENSDVQSNELNDQINEATMSSNKDIESSNKNPTACKCLYAHATTQTSSNAIVANLEGSASPGLKRSASFSDKGLGSAKKFRHEPLLVVKENSSMSGISLPAATSVLSSSLLSTGSSDDTLSTRDITSDVSLGNIS